MMSQRVRFRRTMIISRGIAACTSRWNMFSSHVFNQHFDTLNDLLVAMADSVTYAYGVVDVAGDIECIGVSTKKTTEDVSVDTTFTVRYRQTEVSDLLFKEGYCILLTGYAGGVPALAIVGVGVLNPDPLTSEEAVRNFGMLAPALGYSEWFIAPHFHSSFPNLGAGYYPHFIKCDTGLVVSENPEVSITASDLRCPAYLLDVPANPPHDAGSAGWSDAADVNNLIDHVRAGSGFNAVPRYYQSGQGYHVYIKLRQYITDLENTQDVLRQVSILNDQAIADEATARQNADTTIGGSVTTEATARLNADIALRDAVDGIAIFGNTFKQVVNADKSLDQYIPRP